MTLIYSSSIASVARSAYIKTLALTSLDVFLKIQPIAIISGIEVGLGITAASLATLRPLLRKGVQILNSVRSRSMLKLGTTKPDVEQKGVAGASDPVYLDTGGTTITANSQL